MTAIVPPPRSFHKFQVTTDGKFAMREKKRVGERESVAHTQGVFFFNRQTQRGCPGITSSFVRFWATRDEDWLPLEKKSFKSHERKTKGTTKGVFQMSFHPHTRFHKSRSN
jgi:hypothetical protein